MKTVYAGPRGTIPPGGEIDLPRKEAVAIVGRGFGEYVVAKPEPVEEPEAVVETTEAAVEPETTEAPAPAPRRRRRASARKRGK